VDILLNRNRYAGLGEHAAYSKLDRHRGPWRDLRRNLNVDLQQTGHFSGGTAGVLNLSWYASYERFHAQQRGRERRAYQLPGP
jgi:hypothetical protein